MISRRTLLFSGVPTVLHAGSRQEVLDSAKAMGERFGVTILPKLVSGRPAHTDELDRGPANSPSTHEYYRKYSALSPDCATLAWSWDLVRLSPDLVRESPFLTIERAGGAVVPIKLAQPGPLIFAISNGGEVVVAVASRSAGSGRQLMTFESRDVTKIWDLTPFASQIELPKMETIEISGQGTVVALGSVLGSQERVQVLRVPGGETIFHGVGRFPRVSPDGSRLALIAGGHLRMVNLETGSSLVLLPGTRVMGIGGWSPDGRFLIGGAWTRLLAFEKRIILLDVDTGAHADLGALSEGDYGVYFCWVSNKLLQSKEPAPGGRR
jgi:hypothetical protein